MTTRLAHLVGALAVAIAAGLSTPNPARAQGIGNALSAATCPNSGFFEGGMFTDLCWTCFFPIKILGIPIGAGSTPDGTAAPMCLCPGRFFGIPSPGITVGLWVPSHIFEVVKQPWCSPVIGDNLLGGGIDKASGAALTGAAAWTGITRWGAYGADVTGDNTDSAGDSTFYNWHWWMFPAGVLVNALIGSVCTGKYGSDMDIGYISEIDPTWINDEIAFYTAPEAKLFANPIAVAACAADAVAATVRKPIDQLFWCAGTWGHAYPLTGNINNNDDPARNVGLTEFRALGALHRRTLAKKTYGNSAVCTNQIDPIIPKQQYKLQRMYPMAERTGNHWLGASPFRWGEWRNIPWIGEDFVEVEWRWTDCCITFW